MFEWLKKKKISRDFYMPDSELGKSLLPLMSTYTERKDRHSTT